MRIKLEHLSPKARQQVLQKFEENSKKLEKKSKFKNKKIVIDGISFDSKKESARYLELKKLEGFGLISDLRLQVRYPLVINNLLICTYIADFVYKRDGNEIVEDTKSAFTAKLPLYRLKKKLMKACLGIDIQEV